MGGLEIEMDIGGEETGEVETCTSGVDDRGGVLPRGGLFGVRTFSLRITRGGGKYQLSPRLGFPLLQWRRLSRLGRFTFLQRWAFRSLDNLLVFSLFIFLSPRSGPISIMD